MGAMYFHMVDMVKFSQEIRQYDCKLAFSMLVVHQVQDTEQVYHVAGGNVSGKI